MLSRRDPSLVNGAQPTPMTAAAGFQNATRVWVMAGLVLFGLGILYFGFGGSGQVTFVALGGCIVSLLAYAAVSRLAPRYYAPRLLIVSYGLQFFALAAIAALGLPLSPPYHPFDVNIGDAPVRAVLAMLTVPLGVLLAVAAWRLVGHHSSRIAADPTQVNATAHQRRVYLVIAALAQLFYWPAALESSGIVGYVVRILATAWVVAPFLAGRDSRHDRSLVLLWSAILVLNAGIGIAAGTRSLALIPAVLFTVGYISALSGGRRFAVGALALMGTVPLVQLAGAVGVVRDDLGRGGLELMQADHVREVFRHLWDAMAPGDKQSAEEVNVQGVSRMLGWTNVVVPLMTPDTIPYRSLDGFFDEALQTFRVASMSGLTADDLYDAGLSTAQARVYGFNVSSSTSVEFGLAADAWSRGGAPVVLLFSMIAALGLMVGEWFAHRWHRWGAGIGSILALPVAKAAFFDGVVVQLLPMLRGIILYMLITAVIVVAVEFARRVAAGTQSQHGNVARPRVA